MRRIVNHSTAVTKLRLSVAAVALALALAVSSGANADEGQAKSMFKAMSDYLKSQKVISFNYDTDLQVVTTDLQKVTFASSGTVTLNRPDKIRATRTGGFADIEFVYDGKTLNIFGKNLNLFAHVPLAGPIDKLLDGLRENYGVQAPGADLLLSNVYEQLMEPVTDAKDLGTGIIRGVECNHLAFRTPQVDWEIWIATGDKPYPCRYIISSRAISQAPEYRIELSAWKTGDAVAADDFVFKNASNAKDASLTDLKNIDELPDLTTQGDVK
jgi:hypothetical protein